MALLQAILGGDLAEADRLARPVFREWIGARLAGDSETAALDEALLARLPCRHPIRRVWHDDSGRSGEALLRCGTRSVLSCPSCARLYQGDVRAVIYDGLRARLAAGERLVLLTLTAPSFGAVHRVPKAGRRPGRCRCGAVHEADSDMAGVPLDLDAWDYRGAVVWNSAAPRLFTRTTDALSDWVGDVLGDGVRLQYVRIAEWQARGLIHFHCLLSLPAGVSDEALEVARAGSGRPWVGSVPVRARAIERIVSRVSTKDPGTGVSVRWGSQLRADVLGSERAAFRSAGYVAKVVCYLMKDVVRDGGQGVSSGLRREHTRRLDEAAAGLRCGRPSASGQVTAESERYRRCCRAHSRYGDPRACRGRAHREAGWHGRIFTCSRGWSSLSMTQCRARRRDFRAARSGRVASELSWSWPSRARDHGAAVRVRRDVAAVVAARELAGLAPPG